MVFDTICNAFGFSGISFIFEDAQPVDDNVTVVLFFFLCNFSN